jgi:hypothetical protein
MKQSSEGDSEEAILRSFRRVMVLSICLTMMQHTNMLRRFCVALGVGGKEKCGKTHEIFKERQ